MTLDNSVFGGIMANLFNILISQINLLLNKKPKASQRVIRNDVSENVQSALKEVEEARQMASEAKREAEEAKENAAKEAELARLDAQIETLKRNLPRKPLDAKECLQRYGGFESVSGKAIWTGEAKNCTTLIIPEDIAAGWINTLSGKPTNKIYSNRDIHVPLMLALFLLKRRGLLKELKSFDGCFTIRKQRGGESISYHSWALAIDINAKENPLGAKPVLSSEFVECWKEAGWTWGGDWKRPDGQHFQYVTNG